MNTTLHSCQIIPDGFRLFLVHSRRLAPAMKFAEAAQGRSRSEPPRPAPRPLIASASPAAARPNTLQVFLTAHHATRLPGPPASTVATGLFGDSLGNLDRLRQPAGRTGSRSSPEWADLDPRPRPSPRPAAWSPDALARPCWLTALIAQAAPQLPWPPSRRGRRGRPGRRVPADAAAAARRVHARLAVVGVRGAAAPAARQPGVRD